MKFSVSNYLLFIFFLTITGVEANSQNLNPVTQGIVLDLKTGKPVHLAEIFISGSTKCATTDTTGTFKIEIPYFPCYLVIVHRDYEHTTTYLDKNTEILVYKLNPLPVSQDNEPIVNPNQRRKDLRFFFQQFIGDEMKGKFKILNESSLVFTQDEFNFNATCNNPIVVINQDLGYTMRILIRDFHVRKLDPATNNEVPLSSYSGNYVSKIFGHYYYIPVASNSEAAQKRYKRNRANLYYGSLRHFMKSVYDGELMRQGFQLSFYPQEAVRNGLTFINKGKITDNDSKIKEIRMNVDSLRIDFYKDTNGLPTDMTKPFENSDKTTSIFYPSYDVIKIRPNGTCVSIPFEIKGPMQDLFFLNSLPEDYILE